MAERGGQIGNQNAAIRRVWNQAILNALQKRHPDGRMAALEELAEKLLLAVESGDVSAIKELGDRLDGKAAQPLIGDMENPIRAIVQAMPLDDRI
jgi:hypothetical protein